MNSLWVNELCSVTSICHFFWTVSLNKATSWLVWHLHCLFGKLRRKKVCKGAEGPGGFITPASQVPRRTSPLSSGHDGVLWQDCQLPKMHYYFWAEFFFFFFSCRMHTLPSECLHWKQFILFESSCCSSNTLHLQFMQSKEKCSMAGCHN